MTASAQEPPHGLAGTWTLDRAASQFPKEIGFGLNWATGGSSGEASAGGRRGGRGEGGASRNIAAPRESAEDAFRLRTLTTEVRNPAAQLTVNAAADAVTIADEARTRTFHPTGRQEVLRLQDDVTLLTTARWEGERLVVVYDVEEGRQLRYTYSATAAPRELVVDVQFLERGKGDSVRRIYVPAPAASPAAAPAEPAAAPRNDSPATAGAQATAQADLRPGAELKGLKRLAIVVEDLGSQATACGLTKDAIEKAVTKPLTDAGLQIVRNTDEDTYLYVNVMAASVSGGTCFTRYDATVYTHTTAALPYTTGPVLVQVELLHKGGIAGGPAAANAQAVIGGLTQFVNGFAARIREVRP